MKVFYCALVRQLARFHLEFSFASCSRVIEGITDQKTVSTKYSLGLKTLWLKYSLEYLDPFTIYVDGTDVSKETESSR